VSDRRPPRANSDSRVAPHNLSAEESFLGAALTAPTAAELTPAPADFYKPTHQHIAHAIRTCTANGAVDVITVADELRRAGLLDECGGTDYLLELTNATPSISRAAAYAKIVRDTATLRRLLYASTEIADVVYNAPDDPGTALARATEIVGALTADTTGPATSLDWADLATLLETDLQPEQPQLFTRADGQCLLYPGKIHMLVAESTAGKSWVACMAVVEVLAFGGSAIYLDYEDTPGGITDRLRALGASPKALGDTSRFRYLRAGRWGVREAAEFAEALADMNPDLVVVDAMAGALVSNGLSEDVMSDVETWANMVARPITATGAALFVLDHVVKDPEQRGRYARGTGRKLEIVDGVSYSLRIASSFSRHKAGQLRMVVSKDRPGGVGSIGEVAAVISIEPHADGKRVVFRVEPKSDDITPTDTWKPTILMGQVAELLEKSVAPLTATAVKSMLSGSKASLVSSAIQRLIAEGFVRESSSGRSKHLVLLRPYAGHTPRVDVGEAVEMFPSADASEPDHLIAEHRASVTYLQDYRKDES
jgi:hypothetical protein